ncbi:MAG: glycosyltransferase [Planctomycetota bacterium]
MDTADRDISFPDDLGNRAAGETLWHKKLLFLTVGCINYDCDINFYEPLKQVFSNVINYNYIERINQIGKEAMNAEIIEVVRREKPDYVLLHTYQDQVELETLDTLGSLRTKVVAWFSDDHWRFEDYSRVIAGHVFCSVTTDKHSVGKYAGCRLNVIRSQWASNPNYYRKIDAELIYDVSFVGKNYGKRKENLLYLQNSGVPVAVFGRGFEKFIDFDEMITVINSSRINLNFCGSSRDDNVKQIKGRIFEVPMCGGFLLTEYVDGLEEYFEIGEEIECFANNREAINKISHYLKHEDKRREIAERGYRRALKEHTWAKRLGDLFGRLEGTKAGQTAVDCAFSSQDERVNKAATAFCPVSETSRKRILLATSAAPTQSPFSTAEKRPPIGIGFLISVLRNAGHEVVFLDNYLQPSNFLETGYLQENKIDYVGIYANTICFRDTLRMIHRIEHLRRAHQWHGKVIVGGPHAAVAPHTLPDFVDHVVQGEGERAIIDIVEGRVTDRIVSYPRIENLDELPAPAWDCFANLPYKWSVDFFEQGPVFTMNTSRGCPFRCRFCSVNSVWGRRYTYFSAERIVSDIEYLIKHYGIKGVYFREDNFTLNGQRLIKFCNLLIEKGIRIPWACESRVSTLSRDQVALMARAGAKGFYFGVESGSQRILDFLQKDITVEQVENAFKWCHEFNIKAAASIIVGVPGETQSDRDKTRRLLEQIKPDVVWTNVFVGIPCSSLYQFVLDNRLHEYVDDRGLVYLQGHNNRIKQYKRGSREACIPDEEDNKDMTIRPKVSVLMAVYNCEKFIGRALESVYGQTYQNFEVVVVDDASTDGTSEILLNMKDSRTVIYRNPENKGLTESLNIGLKLCRGEYIARMDADDVSLPTRFEKQVRFLDERPACLAVGSWCIRIDDSEKVCSKWQHPTSYEDIKKKLLVNNSIFHGTAMVRKEVINEAGGYDEKYTYSQDYDLWLRLSELGEIRNLGEYLYLSRVSPEGISATNKRLQDEYAELARQEARRRKSTVRSSTSAETALLENRARAEYEETPTGAFLKAGEEFANGNFEAAVAYMQEYRTTVDYSKFPRTMFTSRQGENIDISIIVVTYNKSEDLNKCLESLSKQDAPCSYEVIVVDNGAGGMEGAARYVDQYVKCPINLVLSEGRNVGACCAKGSIVAFLDDDAVVPSDYVTSIKTAFDTYDIFGLRGKALPKSNPEANKDAAGYDRGDKSFTTFCDLEGNSAFLRDIYLSMNGMDPLLFGHEGSDLTYRITEKYNALNKVIYWPQTVIHHDAAVGDCLQTKRDRYELMDKYLKSKHGFDISRLRKTIEAQPLPESVPRFSFVMIVLNGMPLIEYSLKSIYDFAHEIIIVEGAVRDCMFAANPDGSSMDGTAEFIKSFPDPANKIKLIQGKWPEKCEMQNEALKYVTGSHVWLIDSDEVYTRQGLEKIREILKQDPSITQVNLIPENFWKSLDHTVVSARFFEHAHHYRRLFKYVPGAVFTSHRPPTMVWPGSAKTTEQMHLLDGLKTRQMGVVLYHYSYLSDKQVKQKNDYYGRLDHGANRWGIDRQTWYRECFLKWNPQDRAEVENRYPVWMGDPNSHTQPFKGTHPEAMIEYARKFNRGGQPYPSPPVMQNLVDALDELKTKFPNEHLETIETGTIRTFHAAGASTYCISKALGRRGRLASVDISPDAIRTSKNFCHHASNIEWIQSDSLACLAALKNSKFHFAFLDSVNDKDVVFREFCLLIPMMRENSVLIIDDSGITIDGAGIDTAVQAQKGHEVWRLLTSCGAKFDILRTPNFPATQLRIDLSEANLKLIKDRLGRAHEDRFPARPAQTTKTDTFTESGPPRLEPEQTDRSGLQNRKDFKLPWVSPITRDKWRNFLSHDFENSSRRNAFDILEKYLENPDMVCPLDFVEVGFGQGHDFINFAKRLHDEGKIKYVGYDITEQFVEYARGEFPGYNFHHGGFSDLKRGSFDISYTRHTFEHLSPDLYEPCLRSLLDATRNLCIITWFKPPAHKERFLWSESDGFEHKGAYVNAYARNKIFEVIDSAGFDHEICKPDSNDEIYILKRRKKAPLVITSNQQADKPTIHFAYSGDPCDDRAIRAPRTITNKLFRFLQQRAQVKYYDWADKTTAVDVKPNDIILGHPNPQPQTIIRRLFEKKCAGKYLIWPFHTRIPEINRYSKELAEIADKLFVISGPHWVETIDQTEYATWKEKIVRLDNAIDSKMFPLLKRNFNPAGKRGLFVFGRTGPEKGTRQLFELLCKTNYPVAIAGDYSQSDLQIIENRPDTHVLGRIDWRDPQTTTFILNNCDFFVNMSISDASPTTLLETMALGLIPVTTPECGYVYDSFLLLSLSSEQQNLGVLHQAQKLSDDRLKTLQTQNRRIIEHKHTWDKFCETVWRNIKPIEKPTNDFIAPQHLEECPAPNADSGNTSRKVLVIRSDSIGDFVIFGGAIPYYRKIYPNAHIALVVADTVAELAEACPFIDEVITFNRAEICSRPEYAAEFISLIRQKTFDVAICPALSRDKVSEYIAVNSGAAEKITSSGDNANLPLDILEANNPHFTKIIPMSAGIALETFRNEEFLRGLSVELDGACRPAVWVTKADTEASQQLLSRRKITEPIVVAPFARLDIRNWPVQNWAELVSMYPDLPVIICGTEKDKLAAEKIVGLSNHPNIHNLCGLTTVRELATLIAQSRLCVSSESAAAHFAAVANRPHVVLVGGGHFGRFMPYSSQTKLVYKTMDCYNCDWKCKHGRDIRCIGFISVAMVERAVNEALGRTKPKPVLDRRKVIAPLEESIPGKSDYLVSAIVSTYNSENFIQACLDDLESQTIAGRLEIIVVNSGSQQNEEAIIRRYQQKYDNIVYIETEQREGIYSAWNRAVKVARGQFLTNANTDDRHRPDALEIMADTLKSNPEVALVYGDQIRTDTPNDTFANHHGTEMLRRPDYSRQRLLFGCCVGSQPMWRRSLHDEFGYFDETLTCAGDWDFWIRISSKYEFRRIPEFLGLYYYNEDGIEHGRKIHSLYERYIVGKRYGTPHISVIPLYETIDNPLVSVIMPAYNADEYIAEAIESVLIQNYRNFELVVVNDGSTDDTENIVTHFKDDKIKYFYKPNSGAASARNFAIKKSHGDFIINLDTDDMITPDFIAKHLQEIQRHPHADLVYCDDCLIDENGKPIRVIERPEYSERRLLIRDLFRCGFPIVPFRTFIRRSVFDKIGLYDEQLSVAEDYDMMRRFVRDNLEIHHLKAALYLRRMTSDSLSRSFTARNAKSHFDVVKRFAETFAYDELFPDVAWDRIPPDMRRLHAKCQAAVTYLSIGRAYIESNSPAHAGAAFARACAELNDCLRINPANQQLRQMLQKCELVKARYGNCLRQVASLPAERVPAAIEGCVEIR